MMMGAEQGSGTSSSAFSVAGKQRSHITYLLFSLIKNPAERADLKQLMVSLTDLFIHLTEPLFCPAPLLSLESGLGLHRARHQSPPSSCELQGTGVGVAAHSLSEDSPTCPCPRSEWFTSHFQHPELISIWFWLDGNAQECDSPCPVYP